MSRLVKCPRCNKETGFKIVSEKWDNHPKQKYKLQCLNCGNESDWRDTYHTLVHAALMQWRDEVESKKGEPKEGE